MTQCEPNGVQEDAPPAKRSKHDAGSDGMTSSAQTDGCVDQAGGSQVGQCMNYVLQPAHTLCGHAPLYCAYSRTVFKRPSWPFLCP